MREPRRADLDDLPALMELERLCYDGPRRQSRASLRRSLTSPRQSVWVLEDDFGIAADLILWHHRHTLRVYGVAVRPDRQGKGLGRALVLHAEALAGPARVVLEADAADPRLIDWYERQGYRRTDLRPDFYAPGRHAWRMERAESQE